MGYDSPAAFVKFCRCSAGRASGKQELASAVGIRRMMRLSLVSSREL